MILQKTGRGDGTPRQPCPSEKLKQIQARLLMGYRSSMRHAIERMIAIARQSLHIASAQSI